MSGIVKRSVAISGHMTSISLEDAFWRQLKAIARQRDMSLALLIATVDAARNPQSGGLSSALRVFVLEDAMRRTQP